MELKGIIIEALARNTRRSTVIDRFVAQMSNVGGVVKDASVDENVDGEFRYVYLHRQWTY